MRNDNQDRHVAAAALKAKAEVIVTSNVRDSRHLLLEQRSARTRSSRTFMPRPRPESPEGKVMTSAMRCVLGGKA